MDQDNENLGVKFEEDKWKKSAPSFADETPKIVQLVMKWSGGTISENQAGYVLFGFVAVAIIVSLFLFFSGGGANDADLKLQKLYPPGSPVIR